MAIHQSYPFFGYPRMKVALRKEGLHINHKKVYRLMKEMNIQSVIRKKRRYFGKTSSIVYPNRLNREFHADKPNHVYVTDITYVGLGDRFYYLSAIQDLYNNEIVAWQLSKRNNLELVINTLKELREKKETCLEPLSTQIKASNTRPIHTIND